MKKIYTIGNNNRLEEAEEWISDLGNKIMERK